MRNSYDGEIGRGRRTGNDSSSSRESSLSPKAPKRQFSPVGSDSGEPPTPVELAPVTHSPPPDRPIIRQAVAFATDKPPQNIETYEATPPPVEAVRFLPGQEVPPPTKKKGKRVRKGDLFSSQTSKFRIDTYDPTPSTQPPIAHGNGPYSSLYRGTPAPPKPPRKASPATTATSSTYATTRSATSSNPPSVYAPPYPASSVPTRPLQPPPPAMGSGSPSVPSSRPGPRHGEMDGRPPHQNSYYASHPLPPGPNIPGAQGPSPYYRHDYEKGTWSDQSRSSRHHHKKESGRSHANSDPAPRNKHPLRMVTLLIQDLRSGTIDHQLAEVKVPLRLADEKGSSYWADAQDIAEQLQRGPSRIDGPAKVYTPRGKYRQFILRVSRDNEDDFISANVSVAGDKTIDLVVEILHPPGRPPPPPQIPTGLLDSPNPYEEYEQERRTEYWPSKPQHDQIQDARKRANSPSFDDYDGADSPSPSKITRHSYPSESVRHDSHRQRSLEGTASSVMSSGVTESIPKEKHQPASIPATPPLPSSPRPSAEAEFMRILKDKVREYQPRGFLDFFRSNGGTTLVDTLSQYEYFTDICRNFIGMKIDQFPNPVEEKHILKLLKVDSDPTFTQDCTETLRLMPLYGVPQASRHDPKIPQMINSKFTGTREQARKDLLALLHRSDNIWNNRSPDEPRPPENKSPVLSTDNNTVTPQSEPNPVARVNKSMFVE